MLHCRTVLYSHSKRNRNCYPHTFYLFLHTHTQHAALVGLATFQQICRFSLFRLVGLFLSEGISVNTPSHKHTPQPYTHSKPIRTTIFNINVTKRNLIFEKQTPQMSNGKRIWRRSCRTLRWSTTVPARVRPTGKRTSTSCSRTTTRRI